MKQIDPDLHVPVDSPALNWHLARRAKKLEIPVVYYIAPQVWAWAPWRIRKVRRSIDRLLCILPFEEAYFRKRGVAADFVGHPLLDHLPDHPAEGELPDLLDAWRGGRWRVALLPGSREAEIRHHTAALGRVTQDIRSRWPQASCRITAVDETAARRIRRHLAGVENPPEIVTGRTAEVLGDSHFAVAASGTVTLEVAHFGVPMVVFYKVGAMMRGIYPFARRVLFRTRYLSLVNILGGRGIVPELMPWNGDATKLSGEVLDAMGDVGWLTATRRRLLQISRNLAGPHGRPAAENAADIIAEQLGMSLSDQGI
jgi:lipid-A-disaccharide synthase